MANTKLHLFRSFLTERLTAVAVEIFGEVESIVEGYCEENKRLQRMLNMVLNPEIKLHRIDDIKQTTLAAVVHEHPSEQTVDLGLVKPEPWYAKIKEEQIGCATSQREQPPEGLEGAGALNFATPVFVKTDTEEDINPHPYNIQVVEFKSESSSTVTADEVDAENDSESFEDMEEATDDLHLSRRNNDRCSKCSGCEECGENSTKKKAKTSLQKTMLEFPRTTHYKSFSGKLNDCRPFLTRLSEAFSDMPDDKKPLIAKMGLTDNVKLVDCAFGKVPQGCPLSYQCPVPSSSDYSPHKDSPSPPLLPLATHKLEPVAAMPILTAREQEHLKTLQTSWEAAHTLERSTREQKDSVDKLRKSRLASRFREICHLKTGRSHAEHLLFKMQKGNNKDKDSDKEQKPEALREYCEQVFVNWSPCGLVVHPEAPWLAAVPDGLVYDPTEDEKYGLVHVRCPQIRSFVSCPFLDFHCGVLEVKKNHTYYWQIQGEMMVTGTNWCDLVVYTQEDMLVQRIYRNKSVIKMMKEKLDSFFFHYYLPSLTLV